MTVVVVPQCRALILCLTQPAEFRLGWAVISQNSTGLELGWACANVPVFAIV